jgi:hypothetical protein
VAKGFEPICYRDADYSRIDHGYYFVRPEVSQEDRKNSFRMWAKEN